MAQALLERQKRTAARTKGTAAGSRVDRHRVAKGVSGEATGNAIGRVVAVRSVTANIAKKTVRGTVMTAETWTAMIVEATSAVRGAGVKTERKNDGAKIARVVIRAEIGKGTEIGTVTTMIAGTETGAGTTASKTKAAAASEKQVMLIEATEDRKIRTAEDPAEMMMVSAADVNWMLAIGNRNDTVIETRSHLTNVRTEMKMARSEADGDGARSVG
mmetsp:Transcript_22239/g.61787  ORF Transcript_22239/g.61787 Transcript_22239/m.61787 type:complete len:216 (+) Transcript_22239:1069-1716(+)